MTGLSFTTITARQRTSRFPPEVYLRPFAPPRLLNERPIMPIAARNWTGRFPPVVTFGTAEDGGQRSDRFREGW